ncbi:hypothetical protein CO018_02515 [Candidatus Beckwithbacteria bacterium CG_4_9_14_0_2_um_filter_47_11]|uniref:Uncharacterized protein n=1 Tax=Candidatus Beckwithbacteria bacterium CG_4_9_14_0_2_um_filter_47_11 TaxID=1974494 RepID=A0A2M8G3V7_9BACT|nr:MAG: hypothetical protein CO018_02515 [Candidatus Beckwithbacteria bacterium CG_4_9_14_0_2_um_filter_47_11]
MLIINYIINTPRPAEDLKRINDYFLTFLGEIKPPRLKIKANQIMVICPDNDSTSIPLIKNLHLRIYNPRLKAFIPNDPNLLEVNQTNPIFKQYCLTPVFRYRNSLVFFCRDKSGKIHLINRHLLEYLNSHPQTKKYQDFSVIVAKNIAQFIAKIDRGLIPLDYYQYSALLNFSGLKLSQATKRFICFQFDPESQSFLQTSRELNQIPKKYVAVKINPDIGYTPVKGKLKPYVNVSVYLE